MFTLNIYVQHNKLLSSKESLVHQSCYYNVDDAKRAYEDYCKNNPLVSGTRYHQIVDSNGQHWE